MKKGTHMSEESKKKLSEAVAAAYKLRGNYGHYGVHQKDDEISYRTYQREYKREWYKKNYEKWHDYTMKKSYEKMTTEKLFALRERHSASKFMEDEKRKKLVKIIESVLIERGALTVTCDFEHNYTTVPTEQLSYSATNPTNFETPKPNKIEINGVWYDLVECPIQWEG